MDIEREQSRGAQVEFLLLDNGSTDSSREVAAALLQPCGINWRIEVEAVAGVNFARNAGIRLARGENLIFVDSDLVFRPGWLRAYLEAFEQQPEIEVFAGKVVVGAVEGPIPDWLALSGPWCRPSIVVQADYGPDLHVRNLGSGGGPVGPSMALRRQIFPKYGCFDVSFGLRPGSLLAGAEAEYFDRLSLAGVEYCWVPGSVVEHPLKRSQISKEYFRKRLFGIGRVSARMALLRGERVTRIFGITRFRIRELAEAVWYWIAGLLVCDPQESFFRRTQISILYGYVCEEFVSRRRSGA